MLLGILTIAVGFVLGVYEIITIGSRITNLSAMSEEVSAGSTTSVEIIGKSKEDMAELQMKLNAINELSRKMRAIG